MSLRMFSLSQRHPPIGRLIDVALPLMRATTKKRGNSVIWGWRIMVILSLSPRWNLPEIGLVRVGSIVGLGNTGTGRVLAAFRSPAETQTMRPLHESHFTCMLRRLKAPTVGKIVLTRSFISINSLILCVFAWPESEIIFRAKVSLYWSVISWRWVNQESIVLPFLLTCNVFVNKALTLCPRIPQEGVLAISLIRCLIRTVGR